MYRYFLLLIALLFYIFIPVACSGENHSETQTATLESEIRERKVSLNQSSDFQTLTSDIGEKNLVLLGEASHGTSEFYSWRAELTKELIKTGNYHFIAVEGDWAGLHPVNLYVKHLGHQERNARSILRDLNRWPLWMWANEEVVEFVEWLKGYNADKPLEKRVGFYGNDVYGEWQAKRDLIAHTKRHFPAIAQRVENKLNCIMPYEGNISLYIRQVADGGTSCEGVLQNLLELIKTTYAPWKTSNPDGYFYAVQNAYVIKNVEAHFRLNKLGGAHSWNARVEHMFATVKRLIQHYGENTAGIVWAHNTHIGDARATDMFRYGQVNIGQLSREHFGSENVYSVGFSTHRGKVMAARSWESQRIETNVPEGVDGSLEDILNSISSREAFYFIMEPELGRNNLWINRLGHRAMGVVYNPEMEHRGNYVPTILPNRYNAMIFIPETKAVRPLH